MKRTTFITLTSAAGVALLGRGASGALFAPQEAAAHYRGARADRQWLHGKPGFCAQATGHKLRWTTYTQQQLLTG